MSPPRTLACDTLPPYVLGLFAFAYTSFVVVIVRWFTLGSLAAWLHLLLATGATLQLVRAYLRAVLTDPGEVPRDWRPSRADLRDLRERESKKTNSPFAAREKRLRKDDRTQWQQQQQAERQQRLRDFDHGSDDSSSGDDVAVSRDAADDVHFNDREFQSTLPSKRTPHANGNLSDADRDRVITGVLGATLEVPRNSLPLGPRYEHDDLLDPETATRLRYCIKCEHYKPPRAHHCRDCGRCVMKMDHHCPWVNNCVGIRNHKYFFLFLAFINFESIHMITMFIWRLLTALPRKGAPLGAAATPLDVLLSVVQLCILLPTFLGVSCLFGFQLSLLAGNTTSIESYEKDMAERRAWKKRRKGFKWVYDRGMCANLQDVLGDRILHWLCITSQPDRDDFGLHYERSDLVRDV